MSEPQWREAAWTEERATSDEGRRQAKAPRRRAAGSMSAGNPRLDMDRIIDDRRTRIIVCCGSGGVGKTTAAAAIGLRAAERGRQVCVLTVDPARRPAGLSPLPRLSSRRRRIRSRR